MDSFLSITNEKLKSKQYSTLNIVLGNESCDLDSAVCALTYASYLHWQHEQIKCKSCVRLNRDQKTYKDDIFVPVLNMDREDYDLKTEIVSSMKEYNVDASKFIFRNDYNFEELLKSTKSIVTLVDHHILSKNDAIFQTYVTEVIDHRPIDHKSWKYPEGTRTTLEVVGSCATLVTERIREMSNVMGKIDEYFIANSVAVELLHSTIILDTVNLSKEVDKGTPKDEEMLTYLEKFIVCDNHQENRCRKLERLVRARRDVSSLTAAQLLRKDVKIVGDVLIPSFPILVEEFLKKANAHEAIGNALVKNQCNVALLLGMSLSQLDVERDLAVCCQNVDTRNAIIQTLDTWTTPKFQLELVEAEGMVAHYRQLNKKASRKQILPAVQFYLK